MKTSKLLSFRKKIILITLYLWGSLRGNLVKAYWYDKVINFGDLLAPVILQNYGFTPIRTQHLHADVILIGSILDNLSEAYSGYIVGCGLMFDHTRRFPDAKICAVRGDLTRERIGAPPNTILGDPGLLSRNLLAKRQKKIYEIGIVPHYIDKNNPRIKKISLRLGDDILIIDVQRKPNKVIADIDKCKYIISSSLHGIVVADALEIPNAWIVLSEKVGGNGFKFYDYATALRMKYKPNSIVGNEELSQLIQMTQPVSTYVHEVINNLDFVFKKLQNDILNSNQKIKRGMN